MSTAMQRVSHDKAEWDPEVYRTNEMVSTPRGIQKLVSTYGGRYSGVKYSKCQDLPKFQFFWGGTNKMVSMGDTEISLHIRGGGTLESNTQSAKICLNFYWGGYSGVKYSKCQDLPKFQWGGGALV